MYPSFRQFRSHNLQQRREIAWKTGSILDVFEARLTRLSPPFQLRKLLDYKFSGSFVLLKMAIS
jgi:hypothetical protein